MSNTGNVDKQKSLIFFFNQNFFPLGLIMLLAMGRCSFEHFIVSYFYFDYFSFSLLFC